MNRRLKDLAGLLPGLFLAAACAGVSVKIAAFIGADVLGFRKSPVSPILIAILLGLALRNLLGIKVN